MTEPVKPCPFCNSKPNFNGESFVYCPNAHCVLCDLDFRTYQWNRRATGQTREVAEEKTETPYGYVGIDAFGESRFFHGLDFAEHWRDARVGRTITPVRKTAFTAALSAESRSLTSTPPEKKP